MWAVRGFYGFPILHGLASPFPFRAVMSGLPLSGRPAHKFPAVGFVSSVFHLSVLAFLFLLFAPCVTVFFGWLSWSFPVAAGVFGQVGLWLNRASGFGLFFVAKAGICW